MGATPVRPGAAEEEAQPEAACAGHTETPPSQLWFIPRSVREALGTLVEGIQDGVGGGFPGSWGAPLAPRSF